MDEARGVEVAYAIHGAYKYIVRPVTRCIVGLSLAFMILSFLIVFVSAVLSLCHLDLSEFGRFGRL